MFKLVLLEVIKLRHQVFECYINLIIGHVYSCDIPSEYGIDVDVGMLDKVNVKVEN